MFPSYLEVQKTCSQLYRDQTYHAAVNTTNGVKSHISSLTNTVAAIWREKCGSLLFGEQKIQITTVRSKENDYDIYLKSEKLLHSQYEHKQNVSQLFISGKNWFLAISSLANIVAAIWREKNVDPCFLENKKFRSQLLGARKKIMTSI